MTNFADNIISEICHLTWNWDVAVSFFKTQTVELRLSTQTMDEKNYAQAHRSIGSCLASDWSWVSLKTISWERGKNLMDALTKP